ncbi:hypothetical protein VTN96DRAFT_7207 [Rasamsonia emersonii]
MGRNGLCVLLARRAVVGTSTQTVRFRGLQQRDRNNTGKQTAWGDYRWPRDPCFAGVGSSMRASPPSASPGHTAARPPNHRPPRLHAVQLLPSRHEITITTVYSSLAYSTATTSQHPAGLA